MSYCMLTCGDCGHKGDLFDFTYTPLFGSLPKGQYQCPECATAIQIQSAGELRIYKAPSGDVLAFRDKTIVVPIGARL